MNYEKLDSFSPDLQSASPIEGNLAALQQLFPSVVREGKVDFDALRQLLGDDVAKSDELFGLQWHGKARARRHALMPSLGTLRPCREESKNWDSTQNLYIEGDNLEVLKLLQKSYAGKVKMIYIDPPYNTGGEFVYPDDYQNGINNYLELTGQQDKFKANTETSGRYHTAWLNMMYPRLMLARELLSDDGVIFISIDDHEQSNLIQICNDIFGEENKIAHICHKNRASVSNDKILSGNHNHIILYAKNIIPIQENRNYIGVEPSLEGFNFEDETGKYKLTPVDGPGGEKKGNPYYTFLNISGFWRYSQTTMQEKYKKGLIVRTANGLQQKYYLSQAEASRKTITTWWDKDFLTSTATKHLSNLLGGKYFDNPKSVNLLLLMLKLFTYYDKSSLILDFFSGSATTAHAVMQLNAEDGGKRRYIMVQLPEPCVEGSEAAKAGYANICEIGKERIRRAGEKVKAEAGEAGKDLDIGFRVFKLDSSNVQPWNPEAGMLNLQLESESNLRPERSSDDIFYEVLLKQGIELTEDSRSKEIAGHVVYSLGHGQYYCCFDERIGKEAQELAAGIALWHEKEDADGQNCVVYVRDSAFDAGGIWTGGTSNNSDARKTSFCLTLEQSGIMKVKGI